MAGAARFTSSSLLLLPRSAPTAARHHTSIPCSLRDREVITPWPCNTHTVTTCKSEVQKQQGNSRYNDMKGYPKMADSIGSNGYNTVVTRVLFCGPYWPSFTIYTKEYLRNYPFVQVDEVGLEEVP